MADNNNATKADAILSEIRRLQQQTAALQSKVDAAGNKSASDAAAMQSNLQAKNEEVIRQLTENTSKLQKEVQYLSAQLESVCVTISKMVDKLPQKIAETNPHSNLDVDDLSSRVAAKIVIPESEVATIDTDALAGKLSNSAVGTSVGDIDYDLLAYSISRSLYVPQPQAIAQEIDYEALARRVAEKMPAPDLDYEELGYAVAKRIYVPQAFAENIDYETLAEKVAAKVPVGAASYAAPVVVPVAAPVAAPVEAAPVKAEIDADELAAKIAEVISVQEPISADYIAAKVAEQIVIPDTVQAASADIDVEELSRKVADKIAIPVYEPTKIDEERLAEAVAEKLRVEETEPEETTYKSTLDEEALAENIANRLNFSLSDELIADAVVKNLAGAIDSDEIADCVAKRVGSIAPEQFEITVDDDGCDSLAKAIEEKLDYDVLASSIAEKITPAFMSGSSGEDIDSEELAKAIAEKLSVSADINEDVLADKAAAILSNYMPEIDGDDIADKVIAGIIPALPSAPVIDSEAIASSVTDKWVESQENNDYDIVIDEEGLGLITDTITEDLTKEYGARFDKLDDDVEEIKKMLLSGVVVAAGASETAVTEVVEAPQEDTLFTVSAIVGAEEKEEEPEDEVIEEIVEDIDEEPSEGEIMPDGIPGISGGVDFASMMKYNRSFIARIIQGSDEQKTYYGQVKTALLSYKKVNSNVAWGAERFNKGRETIARFKIRGKTLCLYLALDPKQYPTSVYHHADVSDNKSMHGTAMMVKIKSARGVKKAIRLIDEMLGMRGGEKRNVAERDYAAMYPYETMEELIEDGLVKDVSKK